MIELQTEKERGNNMAVIRVEKTKNYTVMANHHLRNKNMSLKAIGLMSKLLSLPEEWDYSVAGLSAICKEGMTAIRASLKELEENGYLVRERRNSEKGYFVYEYILYEIPHTEKQHTVEKQAEKVHKEESHTEEQTQLNTYSLNKDLSNKDRKVSKKESYDSILAESVVNEDLRELYIDYIRMRQMNGKPLTNRALRMLIVRAERLSNMSVGIQKKMLEDAILNNWNNLYLPNEKVETEQNLRKLKNFYED